VDTNHSAQLDALGDGTRRAILARLVREGPLAVGELAREFPISRPAISQHLRILKDAKLVTDASEGARRVYSVTPEALASLRTYFERFWTDALVAFKRRAEATAKSKAKKRRRSASDRR
jgi:DNA-binding transcriptional ArsR family regulator